MRSSEECYSIDRQTKGGGEFMEMRVGEQGGGDERRTMERRVSNERRYAERRQPERAVAGRRTVHVPDRRNLPDRRGFVPELAG